MNDFYTATGTPATRSAGASASQRGEFTLIQQGFDKLPSLANNANQVLVVNPTGTAIISTTSLAGLSLTALTKLAIRSSGGGAYDLVFKNTETLTAERNIVFKLNDLDRTLNLNGNLQLNNSMTFNGPAGADVTFPSTGKLATVAGVEALNNKTLNGLTISQSNGTLTIGNGKTLTANNSVSFAGLDGIVWSANGNVSVANNFSLTMNLTANTSVTLPTSGTLATLAGIETFNNKTLNSPTIAGTVTHSATTVNYTSGVTLQANGSTALKIEATGEITMPLQSAFEAYKSATTNNATGAGATYTIICDTEVRDQNADYNNGTGVFTAPVAGMYQFNANADLFSVTTAMTGQTFSLVTSSRTFRSNSGWTIPNGGDFNFSLSTCTYMSAGDTAQIKITLSNGAGNTASVSGGATSDTYFNGHLAC